MCVYVCLHILCTTLQHFGEGRKKTVAKKMMLPVENKRKSCNLISLIIILFCESRERCEQMKFILKESSLHFTYIPIHYSMLLLKNLFHFNFQWENKHISRPRHVNHQPTKPNNLCSHVPSFYMHATTLYTSLNENLTRKAFPRW